MSGTKFTESHEWVRLENDNVAVIGITDYAKEQLGDVVYVELPELQQEIKQREEVSIVESVKAASDIKSPVSGTVTEINEALSNDPSLANQHPMTDGWFYKVRLSNPAELDDLLSEDDYQSLLDH